MPATTVGIIIKTSLLLKISTRGHHFSFWKKKDILNMSLFIDYN